MIFAVTPVVLSFYALEEKTKQLTILLVLIHNVCNAVAFPLGKGLRAAGDVKFTMIISLVTTIGIRLVFSVFFGIIFCKYCSHRIASPIVQSIIRYKNKKHFNQFTMSVLFCVILL